MSEAVYITEDGQQFDYENLERKEKCSFCGELGGFNHEDVSYVDGEMPSLHGEGPNGDYANICRQCLQQGVSKEEIDNAIGSREELQHEEVELA